MAFSRIHVHVYVCVRMYCVDVNEDIFLHIHVCTFTQKKIKLLTRKANYSESHRLAGINRNALSRKVHIVEHIHIYNYVARSGT